MGLNVTCNGQPVPVGGGSLDIVIDAGGDDIVFPTINVRGTNGKVKIYRSKLNLDGTAEFFTFRDSDPDPDPAEPEPGGE
jgi:hypothetical protein